MTDEVEKSETAKREEEILAFWKKEGIFEKSLKKLSPKGEFVFYDGPPFATGLPHYGHLLAGTIKDTIPRYKTMRGYHVRRRWGWDCHGLPLENIVEKELGIKTKRDIEHMGVKHFNEAARAVVLRYAEDWKRIVPRFGRWVDMEDDYRSMDSSYTESVWWAFKRLNDKGFVYEGYKAMQLCPRCGTTLSNFEVAQGYKDVTDLSVTVKLPLVDEPGTSLLAWTTTPWTLPGNMVAAVNPDEMYVKVKVGDALYVVAKKLNKLEGEVIAEMKGSELVGKKYLPPFDSFRSHNHKHMNKAWKVYAGDFVTMDTGTGIVHIAPAFGADDLALAQKENIPIVHHVDKEGHFIPEVTEFAGMLAKPKDDPQSTDVAVIKYLAAKDLLFSKEKIVHSYPHCWRCDTPLINYATSSWFIEVTKFKDKLVSENKKVGWVPDEIGQNRFGDWLENARDWAISRARYWGAPIPVWEERGSKEKHFVGSVDDLKKLVKKSGNKYFVMRHGEAENNVAKEWHEEVEISAKLTEKGKEQIVAATKGFNEKVDVVISSPVIRDRATTELVCAQIGYPLDKVVYDERIREWRESTEFEGRPQAEMEQFYQHDYAARPHDTLKDGESFAKVIQRTGEFLYELEQRYAGKTVLVISHAGAMRALQFVAEGYTFDRLKRGGPLRVPDNGVIQKIDFTPLPHNDQYELDLHRPYIDDVILEDDKGRRLHRVPDVFDCWFESGSMPYAQDHYPFENKKLFDPEPGFLRAAHGYPADFIAEGLDQTRGWFYSLIVLGVGLFGRAPYKNVIVNGTVLAEDGQKMSKRLKNYPDPLDMVDRSGADAVRYYLLASPVMHAEDLSFSEKGVAELASKFIGRFTNVLSFYAMYQSGAHATGVSTNPLDRWILARLSQTINEVEKGMEAYEIDRAARPLMDFVDDLSTWYLRRSRDRFKGPESADALATTRTVLKDFSKVLAPFTPFVAEQVYQAVKDEKDPESVHLCDWPQAGAVDEKLLIEMSGARELVSLALEKRQKANIKVRQPLQKLTVNSKQLTGKSELLDLIKDEVNVKEVMIDAAMTDEVELDTTITDALREEGELRDVLRAVMDLRKQADLAPKDQATLVVASADKASFAKHWDAIREVGGLVKTIDGETTHVEKS